MKILTVLIDADDTIENLCEEWVKYLNEKHGTSVLLTDIKEWDIAKRRKKKIYLVILDYIDESNIPPRYDFWWSDISSTQSVSALKYGFEACADMIIEAVGYVVENEMAQISIADSSDINMKKNVNHDIPVEENTDSASADNRESNVAELVDQSSADDFEIEDGVLKEYKGNSSVVRIPYGVTSIGDKAFYFCKTLTSVVIPDSVTSIGSKAFYCCKTLTSVVIGNGVTSIGDDAFKDCYKLVEVINKSSLNIARNSSNYGYAGKYALEIHKGESKIVNQDGYLFYTYNGVNYLLGYAGDDTALTLPESYNGQDYSIYQFAFCGNSSITSVVIPDSVTSIGEHAFYGCLSLTSIRIPDGVTSIGSSAFDFCHALTSIVIPDSVTKIESYAFSGCSSLTSIVYRGTKKAWKRISFGDDWISKDSKHTLRFEP